MNEMIERVARALYAADGLKHAAVNVSLEESWEMSPRYHEQYRLKAKVAIKAMREPTEAMLNAGLSPTWKWIDEGADDVWIRMIDAALAD